MPPCWCWHQLLFTVVTTDSVPVPVPVPVLPDTVQVPMTNHDLLKLKYYLQLVRTVRTGTVPVPVTGIRLVGTVPTVE